MNQDGKFGITAAIACGAVLLIGAVALFPTGAIKTSIGAQTPKPTPLPEDKPYIGWFMADDFGDYYDGNNIAAKTNYGGKRIALRGVVKDVSGDLSEGYLQLKAFRNYTEVTCIFNSRSSKQLANVKDGMSVDVIGDFDGGEKQSFSSDKLTMTDCSISTYYKGRGPGMTALTSQPAPVEQPRVQAVSNPAERLDAELVGVRIVPHVAPNGREMRMVLIDWRNSGTAVIRGVAAEIRAFNEQGVEMDCSTRRQWIYASKSGINPGATYMEPQGDGYVLIPLPGEGQGARCEVRIVEVSGESEF